MKDLEIIVQDEITKHWKLNGTPGILENLESNPEEQPPFKYHSIIFITL